MAHHAPLCPNRLILRPSLQSLSRPQNPLCRNLRPKNPGGFEWQTDWNFTMNREKVLSLNLGTDANGKAHKVRLYSIASPTYGEDGDGKVLATTCKRLIGEREPQSDKDDPTDHRLFLGVCSNHVCDLRAGDLRSRV